MSLPVSSFRKLSISQSMQSSRGHAQGQVREKGRGLPPDEVPSSSEEEEEEEEDDDDEEEGDDDDTETQQGREIFALDHCREVGGYYAFQIASAKIQTVGVRIASSGTSIPTCSCNRSSSCPHIPWLISQLKSTRDIPENDSTPEPYDLISTLGLKNVCEELHWELRQGTDSDSEETVWHLKKDYLRSGMDRHTRTMLKERMKEVRMIMAALSPVIADEYRADIFNSSEDIGTDNMVVTHDLEATISRMLAVDDDLYYKFKSLISRNDVAVDYFRKMRGKAQNACHLLDQYIQSGPVAGHHDVIWCGNTLVAIVNKISSHVTERAPLGRSSREEAAITLVGILHEVVINRNHDAYQRVNWQRRPTLGEKQKDRNLYQLLIGSASRAGPADGSFVIKALQDLADAADRCVEDLEHILETIQSNGWGAPLAYVEKLSGLITQLKGARGGSGPSSASSKRPAGREDRKVKRMK
ncbi:hypothetical protein F5884DRAFT_168437 [Xylogone sp. PMI_703]|nr:hypothetical protein F5884DRAFT_168437 [Xylogone sp. PMI_703]